MNLKPNASHCSTLLTVVLLVAALWTAATAEDFDAVVERTRNEKPKFAERQKALLTERYDLADRPTSITMSRGKPIQEGVRVKLPKGTSWDDLAAMSPDEIKTKKLWPAGFYPLPHPHGGVLQPRPRREADRSGEEGPGRVHASVVGDAIVRQPGVDAEASTPGFHGFHIRC